MQVSSVTLRVFGTIHENEAEVRKALREMVPFDLDEEKIPVRQKKAEGFEDQEFRVLTVEFTAKRHIRPFLKFLKEKLDEANTKIILSQLDERMDEDGNLYLRFDMDHMLTDRKYEITTLGDCFHVKIKIATFPKNREVALKDAREFLT